jgi:signal transduction histidine kinase
VLASSIILAFFSYNYFTQTANQIQELAINDLQTNAEIEAYSISNSLSNAIYVITSNLRLIANSPSTMETNVSKIQTLLDVGLQSTSNLTDGYYYLDNNGRLKTFTGIEKEQNANYIDIDLSHREYFKVPKQNQIPYISTVIDSNDNVPRMYISYPILENNQTTRLSEPQSNVNLTSFKGVVFASVAAKTLGNFLEGQVHPKFNGNIAFMDRNGTIIYTQNQTFIGKEYFGNDFQIYLKSILKDKTGEFNNIISEALDSESGLDEFNFENTSTTIAYEAVVGPRINDNGSSNDSIGTLFITIPHTLAGDVASLIDNQQITNFFIIALIAVIASTMAMMLLRWNNTLKERVTQKTAQLNETVDKLKKANEDLNLHDKMQKEFINVAAHELRTPSQAISGNLELIEMTCLPSLFEGPDRGGGGGEKLDTFDAEFQELARDKDKLYEFKSGLVSTYRNSQRLEKLVNNILDVSRIESQKLQLNKEYFNLNEKIKNVIKDIRSKNTSNPLSNNLEENIKIDFEPPEDPITVYADKIRMFEVISNLLTNAIKFSDGKPITITVKKIQKNDINFKHTFVDNREVNAAANIKENQDETIKTMMMAVVSIRDRGKGIDSDILPRLFTKFTTKSSKGTGLGLYISKSIIEAHGGQIWAQNNYDNDKGATFSFSLPLDK